jgi:hypothetical protein
MKQMLSALVVAGLLAVSACNNSAPAPQATTGGTPPVAETERLSMLLIKMVL